MTNVKLSALGNGQNINVSSGTGNMDSIIIGATTPEAGTFTTISGNGNSITGSATGLTAGAVPASGITGTTLASNVVTSSITTIGSNASLPGSPTTTTQVGTDNSTKVSTTAFVTNAINNLQAALDPAIASQAATTTSSDTSGFTYSNGSSGVGATLTGNINTAVTIDGFTFTALGQRLLVKDDAQSPGGAFNGLYILTRLQTAILAPIFTRTNDYNSPSTINNTGAIPVVNGTINKTTSWLLISFVSTVGTDPLTYRKFSDDPTTIVNTITINSTNGFGGSSSGGISPALTLTTSVNGIAKGNGTALSTATSGTDYSNGTSGLATGVLKSTTSTGALTIAAGSDINSTFGSQTQNTFYSAPDGSNNTPSFRTIVAADIPTLNQNTSGSASKWTTARNLGGNSVNGSADVAFANKFIVQGTSDTGLSGAQFMGALATGILKSTTSTGVLSIATASTDYAPATTGSSILKASSGGFANAVAGTDFCGITTGSSVLKGSSGNTASATAGTDYSAGTSALSTGILKSTTSTGALTIATVGTDYSVGTSSLATGLLKSTTTTGALSIATSGTDYVIPAGNVATANALAAAVNIGNVSFDGSTSIVPQTIQTVDETTDTSCFLAFTNSSGTQSQQIKTNGLLTFNAAVGNGTLSAPFFSGSGKSLTGTASSLTAGNVTLNANMSGVVVSSGSNVTTFGTFTSSALLTACSDETGSGSLVGSSNPVFTTPAIAGSSSGKTTIASANTSASNFTVTIPALTDTITLGQSCVCTSGFTKTSNTTLADVTGMSLVLPLGTYNIDGYIDGTAGATGGIKLELIQAATIAVSNMNIRCKNYNGATLNANTKITGLGVDMGGSAAAYTDLIFTGTFTVTTAGTVKIQAAQNTSSGTATTISVNSYMTVVRVS